MLLILFIVKAVVRCKEKATSAATIQGFICRKSQIIKTLRLRHDFRKQVFHSGSLVATIVHCGELPGMSERPSGPEPPVLGDPSPWPQDACESPGTWSRLEAFGIPGWPPFQRLSRRPPTTLPRVPVREKHYTAAQFGQAPTHDPGAVAVLVAGGPSTRHSTEEYSRTVLMATRRCAKNVLCAIVDPI